MFPEPPSTHHAIRIVQDKKMYYEVNKNKPAQCKVSKAKS